MKESQYKLREKTVALAGPLTSTTQSIASLLVEYGADVAFIQEEGSPSQRFINSLNDMREVNAQFGRAALIEQPIQSPADAYEAISRAAETFGALDVFIDANLMKGQFALADKAFPDHIHDVFHSDFHKTVSLTHSALQFLEGRGKGRILFLLHGEPLCHLPGEGAKSLLRSSLSSFCKTMAQEVTSKSVTVNALSVGATEEFLLNRYPDAGTVSQALEQLQKELPQARLVNSVDLAQVAIFLVSSLGGAITGQNIVV